MTLRIAGQKFGKLTAREIIGRTKTDGKLWRCDCECGGSRVVPACLLVRQTNPTVACRACVRAAGLARKRNVSRDAKIRRLRDAGATQQQIAEQFGISQQRIAQILAEGK